MSSDSLGFAAHDKESSDEEAQIQGHLPAGRSKEEEQVHPAICHQEDSSVPADVEGENDLLTDEEEQLSETFVVTYLLLTYSYMLYMPPTAAADGVCLPFECISGLKNMSNSGFDDD